MEHTTTDMALAVNRLQIIELNPSVEFNKYFSLDTSNTWSAQMATAI